MEGWQRPGGLSGWLRGSDGIGKPCQMAGRGREALLYGCEGMGGVRSPPGGPG